MLNIHLLCYTSKSISSNQSPLSKSHLAPIRVHDMESSLWYFPYKKLGLKDQVESDEFT